MIKEEEGYLDRRYAQYKEKVRWFAEHMFYKYVQPWLKEHECTFRSGMGTFSIRTKGGTHLYSQDYPELVKYLYMDIPGMQQDLGSLMPDYEETK